MPFRLPIDRSVVVTVTREDRFPTTAGFNTHLLLTTKTIPGELDEDHRTLLISDIYEVGVRLDSTDEAYKAAQKFFDQPVRPPQLKLGWRDPVEAIADEMDAIYQQDPDWFWLSHTKELNDSEEQRELADWAESHEVLLGADTNDTDTETASSVDDVTFAATISQASPGVVTKTAHGLEDGDIVQFTTSGTLPAPLVAGTAYFVVGSSANTFNVALTDGGSAIATTTAGSGTHTVTNPQFGGSFAEYIELKAYDHTAAFYHTDPNSYLAAAAWGYAAGRDLDRSSLRLAQDGDIDSGQAYTLKFKTLRGVTPINKPSSAVQSITGFVPGLGSSVVAGHRANTYVQMGGLNQLVEGTVGSGAFIDEIHASSWIRARVQESMFAALSNKARVPMTNQGVSYLIETGVNPPMRRAFAAGVIAPRDDEDTGELIPAFQVAVDDVTLVPVSQRRNRIAPDIKVVFQYAGAIHFASATMILKF